jgi:hypothetical protein
MMGKRIDVTALDDKSRRYLIPIEEGLTMSPVLTMLLLAVAFVLFVLATFGVTARVNLLAAGLAVWVLVQFLALVLKA